MSPDPIACLQAGGVVFAANARLAWTLGLEYDRRQAAAGKAAWPTATVATPESWWAARQAEQGGERLLSPAQERLMWADIIAADASPDNPMLDVGATARLAASAWERLHAWRLPLTGGEWQETEETLAFQRWAGRFARHCRERGWTTGAELADRDSGPFPAAIGLAGFHQPTPQMEAWLARARAAGSSITDCAPSTAPGAVRGVSAADGAAELAAAAAWARDLLDRGASGPIGVVVADLAARRQAAERAFAAALHPGREPGDTAPRAYRLSLGPALDQHPLTAAALRLLEIVASSERRVPMDAASAVVLSPFVGGAEHTASQRAGQDFQWRNEGWANLPRSVLKLPAWNREPAAYSTWADRFATALDELGWPGERALSSDEHQTAAAWQELLDELAGLDAVSARPVEGDTALRQLRALARERPFQPRARRWPAVHVMGLLEASGQAFTHLWIAGLDDRVLPAPAAPQPLLPRALQNERGLPGANPAVQAAFARTLWDRLRCSAPVVVASHARADGDTALHPSPLLPSPVEPLPPATAAAVAVAWERFDDDQAPPVPAARRHANSGMFTEQSQCAFRAFAHRRLRARAPAAAVSGLSAAARGTLLHDALKRWQQGASIEDAASQAVAAERLLQGRPALARLVAVGLAQQIAEWQEVEAKLALGRTVACEQSREAEFAGWTLSLRVDRVVEFDGRRQMLLDYKSGDTAKSHWHVDRFLAPQLPLYLVTSDGAAPVDAIAFAQLKRGGMSLKAATRDKRVVPRSWVPEDGWDTQIQAWRGKLESLAVEHASGRAAVAPLIPGVCEHCDLHGLCRVGEQPPVRALPDAEDQDV